LQKVEKEVSAKLGKEVSVLTWMVVMGGDLTKEVTVY